MARHGSTFLACLALGMLVWSSGPNFIGSPGKVRNSRTVMHLGHGYQERMSPRAHDPGYKEADSKGAKDFTAADATGATAEVVFKKRPFGILRYAPGAGGKDAMVMEIIPKSRYPGDPQGQAFAAGVQSGWIVKSINGEEVTGQSFAKIMDMLDDEVMDQRMSQHFYASQKEPRQGEPVSTPITVVYQERADVQSAPASRKRAQPSTARRPGRPEAEEPSRRPRKRPTSQNAGNGEHGVRTRSYALAVRMRALTKAATWLCGPKHRPKHSDWECVECGKHLPTPGAFLQAAAACSRAHGDAVPVGEDRKRWLAEHGVTGLTDRRAEAAALAAEEAAGLASYSARWVGWRCPLCRWQIPAGQPYPAYARRAHLRLHGLTACAPPYSRSEAQQKAAHKAREKALNSAVELFNARAPGWTHHLHRSEATVPTKNGKRQSDYTCLNCERNYRPSNIKVGPFCKNAYCKPPPIRGKDGSTTDWAPRIASKVGQAAAQRHLQAHGAIVQACWKACVAEIHAANRAASRRRFWRCERAHPKVCPPALIDLC